MLKYKGGDYVLVVKFSGGDYVLVVKFSGGDYVLVVKFMGGDFVHVYKNEQGGGGVCPGGDYVRIPALHYSIRSIQMRSDELIFNIIPVLAIL